MSKRSSKKTTSKAKRESDVAPADGRYAYEGLDRVMHEKARLGLMTCLAGAAEGLTFGELKKLCDLTDGNLNRHLKQLVDAGLVALDRDETTKRPVTTCVLTTLGRDRFREYLAELQRVIGDAQSKVSHSAKPTRRVKPT